MSKNKFNPVLTSALFATVFAAGAASAGQVYNQIPENVGPASQLAANIYTSHDMAPANSQGQYRYILRFKEPALALYKGTGAFAAPVRQANGKIDVNGAEARNYVSHLKSQQDLFASQLSSVLGRTVTPVYQLQYAFNGMAVYLDPSEVSSVKQLNQVADIRADKDYELDTDAGPRIIGADNVWLGDAPAAGAAMGEGMVIGTLDSGTNFDHPSFDAMGGDGYVHNNPLGSGNYLGVCDAGNTDQYLANYTCNDKLIGGYDFVNGLEPAGATEIPGPEDENGHGSHTSSTSGGNQTDGDFNGVTVPVSGVAPHATNVIFDVCYEDDQGRGLCPGISSMMSVDQAIADGMVDVINFSIGGGSSPWEDPVSRAFVNATEAGIFVATSAGNSGPGAGTLGHVEPWTTSVGATTHDRRVESLLNIGATPALQDIGYLSSADGPGVTSQITGELRWGEDVDPTNRDGCNPWAADAFDGEVAFVDIFTCPFAQKVVHATDAGAIAVVVMSNTDTNFFMGGMGATTVPSMTIPKSLAEAAVTEMAGGTLPIVINTATVLYDGQADVMAGFSSRGPSGFEYNKPDVSAPGVSILAAYDDDTVAVDGGAEFAAISGTSMASPHVAGSAALLRQLQPTWTPMEVKSALMMTAKKAGNTKEDGITPTDHFDDGAGRIQVDVASSTGLVMHESAFNMLLADPDNFGDPKTINAPNLTNFNCIDTCSFERSLRSVASAPVTYNASLVDIPGTVNPAQFTVNPGETVTLDIEVNGAALPPGATSFGELMIAEQSSFGAPNPFSIANSIDITDGGYVFGDGNAAMSCEDVVVSGITSSSLSANVELGASHTWVGDMTAKLINPDGDELALFSRPAFPASSFGTSSDLAGTSPVTFVDGGATDAEAMGAGGGVICQDDGLCEYYPNPDEETASVADFSSILTGTINGTWQICGGDAFDDGNGIGGTIDTATLNISEGAAPSVPALHMPAVIIGFPNAPEIDVTPTSLAATIDADMTTDLTLNIANLDSAGADLNWMVNDTGKTGEVDQVLLEQLQTGLGNGIVSDYFDDGVTNGGAYSADDFTLAADTTIDGFFFDGFTNGTNLADEISSFSVLIYPDAAGAPAGHPEDGGGTEIASVTLSVGDYRLNLSDGLGSVYVNLADALGGSLDLTAGTYWVVGYANFTGANRWNWFTGTPGGTVAKLVDPTGIFGAASPNWLIISDLTGDTDFDGLAFNAHTLKSCGASWLSVDTSSGVLSPGSDIDVTVTLDSTGMMPGVYEATLCIDSDDLDETRVAVPVTLTVDGPSDLIFANGFEAPAP
ncbi:S8 family serine peptidase [Marinicella rhabdoformis]|uniref:S8 family serine peptidase n=1 Tax=Marinicella rhabdoformis TaxID=2580566 RepID=UPI0012AEDECA|nr:S8 family serine peptidase [Marinicella rhabdoformis]